MQINDAASILVLILAGVLAVFLLMASIAAYKLIQVLQHLKSISDKAEKLADSAEHVGDFFKHAAGPAALVKLIANITESVFKQRKKKRKDGDEY